MRRKKAVLVGVGAQAKYVCDILMGNNSVNLIGYVDLEPHRTDRAEWLERLRLGGFSRLQNIEAAIDQGADCAIVCHADPHQKQRLSHIVDSLKLHHLSAIHPDASVSRLAEIGAGSIINAGAVVQPFARLGRGAMVHARTVVEHDNVLGDFVNLGPGVSLAGHVSCGDRVRAYTGAIVIPQIALGADCTIGAGAVVLQNVAPGTTVVGVPARPIGRAAIRTVD
jgi:sugar O-acyltransferase (sialic acid O-acetyltransferase NeuD family)